MKECMRDYFSFWLWRVVIFIQLSANTMLNMVFVDFYHRATFTMPTWCPKGMLHVIIIIIIIMYPLIVTVVGAPQMISRPVSSIFTCSPLPSVTWRTQGLSIPWCCLPTSSSVCLVFFRTPSLTNVLCFPDVRHVCSTNLTWIPTTTCSLLCRTK